MAQRESGYERKTRDAYMTPAWVTEVLLEDLERQRLLPVTKQQRDPTMASAKFTIDTGVPRAIWECAAGTGQMADVMAKRGYEVFCSDIEPEPGVGIAHDFTQRELPLLMPEAGAIITNPPYDEAETFVANALDLMAPKRGLVALLLKVDWDSAKTRRRFFADCPAWCRKLVLTDRIHWFDPEPGSHGPSENHAWFVWDWRHHAQRGLGASLAYAAAPQAVRDALRAAKRRVVA